MPQPLTGYTIVEMGTAIQGPAAGIYLSDMGADVIKVEPPIGDASRFHRGVNNETPPETPGAMFTAGNRGKRSVCLGVNADSGIEVVRRLVRSADVFMTNYRAPFLNRLGLDYASLTELNPNLIYASVNGFGPLGPDADRPMVEGAVQARGGLASVCGPADSLPMPAGATIADGAGALQFALGIVTALLARERHGVGQKVNTSSLGTQIWLQSWEIQQCLLTGKPLHRAGSQHAEHSRAVRRLCGERWRRVSLYACRRFSLEDILRIWRPAPNWQTIPSGITHSNAWVRYPMNRTMPPSTVYVRIWPRSLPGRTSEEWSEFFRARDDVIVEKIQDHAEVAADPQTIANEYVVPMSFAGVGESRVVGNQVQLSETPGSVKGAPPELGNATREVMLTLGFAQEEVDATEEHTAAIRKKILGA